MMTLVDYTLSALAEEGRERAAERAALEWLALVDELQYEASWIEAASLFKAQVSAIQWEKMVTAVRSPLGKLVDRQLSEVTYAASLPGAPDGEYVVLQFKSIFENKRKAVETITPMFDDGRWRVSGYFVR